MPLQKVTLDVDVPEGYEATGEWRRPIGDEPHIIGDGRVMVAHPNDFGARMLYRIILRKLPDPVEEWLAQHPWLPEGRWVYRFASSPKCWGISQAQPYPDDTALTTYSTAVGKCSVNAFQFAGVLGQTFTPPPVDCLRVKRTKPCP